MITNNIEEALLLSDRIVPMTRGPRATLGTPVEVAMPKPRTAAQLVHDEEAMRVRTHVIESLTAEVRQKVRSSGHGSMNRRSWDPHARGPLANPPEGGSHRCGARARPDARPDSARADRSDEDLSNPRGDVRRGGERQRDHSRGGVRLHPGPLRLRQIHRAVDHRRAAASHARRRRDRRHRGRRARRRSRRRLSVAMPAAVAHARARTWRSR